MASERNNFHPMAGQNFSLSYTVTSYPDSDIKWWRSRDGMEYVHIASCSPKEVGCEKSKEINDPTPDITNSSFEIKNLEFPQDSGYYYKCNASNDRGNDSKGFHFQVYGNVK